MNECIYKLTFHFFVRKCKKSKINLKKIKYKFIPFTSYNINIDKAALKNVF